MEDNLKIKIKPYESSFDANLRQIEEIEERVIKKLAQLVELP